MANDLIYVMDDSSDDFQIFTILWIENNLGNNQNHKNTEIGPNMERSKTISKQFSRSQSKRKKKTNNVQSCNNTSKYNPIVFDNNMSLNYYY